MHDDSASTNDRRTDGGEAGAEAPDLQALARDWVSLWESELTAIAADREAQETWRASVALWSGLASAMLAGLPRGTRHDGGDRDTSPPRTAPAAAAPDPRDAEIERLARHIDTLERRLQQLERAGSHPVRPARRRR
jgi:ubiquinone biosynthesis protein UbiJ